MCLILVLGFLRCQHSKWGLELGCSSLLCSKVSDKSLPAISDKSGKSQQPSASVVWPKKKAFDSGRTRLEVIDTPLSGETILTLSRGLENTSAAQWLSYSKVLGRGSAIVQSGRLFALFEESSDSSDKRPDQNASAYDWQRPEMKGKKWGDASCVLCHRVLFVSFPPEIKGSTYLKGWPTVSFVR